MLHRTPSRKSCVVEPLEERTLLSWSLVDQLVHIDRLNSWYPAVDGTGVTVAVLDTGVNTGNSAINSRSIVAWKDFVGTSATPVDPIGHGTAVTGVIAANTFSYQGSDNQGVAPGVKLVELRTDDGLDATPWSVDGQRLLNGLDWVIANRATYNITAINISTGYGHFSTKGVPADANAVLDQSISDDLAQLKADGVFIAASSGNNGVMNPLGEEFPASDPSVIGVGSVNGYDQVSSFTERGSIMDMLAPGEAVPVLWGNSTLAGNGTSFAAPFVTGAAAMLQQLDPTLTPDEITQLLESSATTDNDSATGLSWPRIDLSAAVAATYAYSDANGASNSSISRAIPITLDGSGNAALSGMRLLLQDQDYYSFAPSTTSDVTFGISSTGSYTPEFDLLDSSGNQIATLGSGQPQRLRAATYYLKIKGGDTTLDGTYGFWITATPLATPAYAGANGNASSSAFDRSGNLYMAYYDSGLRTLDYAVRSANGTWSSTQMVDVGPYAGQMLSLALDASGLPGIAYLDGYAGHLKYAHFNGRYWSTSVIDAGRSTGLYPSLKYTKTGLPAIAYYSRGSASLRFAAFNGRSWQISTVDASGNAGSYASLALDPSVNRWAIAYQDTAHNSLKFTEQNSSGQWVISTVDVLGRRAEADYVSLAFDAYGHAGIAYLNDRDQFVKYATPARRGWTLQAVTTGTNPGLFDTLHFTAGARPQIVYLNTTDHDVYVASSGRSGWANYVIGTGGGYWLSSAWTASDGLTYIRQMGTDLSVTSL